MQASGALLLVALVICPHATIETTAKPSTSPGSTSSPSPTTVAGGAANRKPENGNAEVNKLPLNVLSPYKTAPLAFNHMFLIVVLSTVGAIVFVHLLLFVIYFALLVRPISRHPTQQEKERFENEEDDEDEDGNTKRGSKVSQKKKKNGQAMSRVALGSKASIGGSRSSVKKSKKMKGGSKDFQFDDKDDIDTGTLMMPNTAGSAVSSGNVGQSQETKTDLRSATPRR